MSEPPVGEVGPGRSEDRGPFDHHARLARRLLRVPVALVTVLEPERQLFRGAAGLRAPWSETRETALSHSFCQHVVATEAPFLVSDARTDARVADNPAIDALGVVAYLGWPLVDGTGRTIGSLCAIDHEPRRWSADDVAVLGDLARGCSAELTAVRDSEQLVRTVMDSIDVALAFFDPREELLLANDLAVELCDAAGFRLDRPPFAGPHVRYADNLTAVPPEDQVVPRALRGEVGDQGMRWVGPPGNQVAVVTTSRRVRRADGSLWGTLVAGYEVTALARALEVKDQFIATVSHELRTPLTSIIGNLEILADQVGPPSQEVADTLDRIERGTTRLRDRIAELLAAAETRRRLDLRSTDLAELVGQVCTGCESSAAAAGLRLRAEGAGPQWATVDARRVEQAVENLVANALKYTRPGGTVTVAVGGDEHETRIDVVDTGIGMSGDEVDQACEAFWRAGHARRTAVPGIGIGLSFVRDIVEAHRGSVAIASRPGEGTTVSVTLPRDPGRLDA